MVAPYDGHQPLQTSELSLKYPIEDHGSHDTNIEGANFFLRFPRLTAAGSKGCSASYLGN